MNQNIAKINVYLSNSSKIYALQLIDDKGNFVVDLKFDTGPGDWYSRKVPAGREIIGLFCNTD